MLVHSDKNFTVFCWFIIYSFTLILLFSSHPGNHCSLQWPIGSAVLYSPHALSRRCPVKTNPGTSCNQAALRNGFLSSDHFQTMQIDYFWRFYCRLRLPTMAYPCHRHLIFKHMTLQRKWWWRPEVRLERWKIIQHILERTDRYDISELSRLITLWHIQIFSLCLDLSIALSRKAKTSCNNALLTNLPHHFKCVNLFFASLLVLTCHYEGICGRMEAMLWPRTRLKLMLMWMR